MNEPNNNGIYLFIQTIFLSLTIATLLVLADFFEEDDLNMTFFITIMICSVLFGGMIYVPQQMKSLCRCMLNNKTTSLLIVIITILLIRSIL